MGINEIPKCTLLLLLLFCEIIGIKQYTSTDNLDQCQQCKILTDSINYWLDHTSRGKYEGGDAAWEEAKLKSYSRSEIRLVEIQEGLCSELKTHQDACYTLAEQSEQVLEKWWFTKDPISVDLHTWVCIEALKLCCPSKHYGEECTPCPQDKSNQICAGHGKCDGDGTRKGNGTCICKKGYSGTMCNECSKNYYQTTIGSCKVCHKSCNGCSADGASACIECNSGWQLQSGVCVDIDECSSSICEANKYCINSEGYYGCKDCDLSCKTCMGEGPSNCTSCEASNVLWFGMCINSELKQSILTSSYKRLALYMGLLIMTVFISKTSIPLASIIVLIIAIYVYISEKNLRMSTLDVVFRM